MTKHATATNADAYLIDVVKKIRQQVGDEVIVGLKYHRGEWRCNIAGSNGGYSESGNTPSAALLAAWRYALGLSMFWQPLGWQWYDGKEPPGYYKNNGNGYMDMNTAVAEMQRVQSGVVLPF